MSRFEEDEAFAPAQANPENNEEEEEEEEDADTRSRVCPEKHCGGINCMMENGADCLVKSFEKIVRLAASSKGIDLTEGETRNQRLWQEVRLRESCLHNPVTFKDCSTVFTDKKTFGLKITLGGCQKEISLCNALGCFREAVYCREGFGVCGLEGHLKNTDGEIYKPYCNGLIFHTWLMFLLYLKTKKRIKSIFGRVRTSLYTSGNYIQFNVFLPGPTKRTHNLTFCQTLGCFNSIKHKKSLCVECSKKHTAILFTELATVLEDYRLQINRKKNGAYGEREIEHVVQTRNSGVIGQRNQPQQQQKEEACRVSSTENELEIGSANRPIQRNADKHCNEPASTTSAAHEQSQPSPEPEDDQRDESVDRSDYSDDESSCPANGEDRKSRYAYDESAECEEEYDDDDGEDEEEEKEYVRQRSSGTDSEEEEGSNVNH